MDQNETIIKKVKEIVYRYDPGADIIFFGSRARGDHEEESDWDFLILSSLLVSKELKSKVRKDILEEIEWKTFEVIQTIWHNKQEWEDNYRVTNIYESIKAEGILV
jgi:predicted nucleotidyltransferase